MAIEYIVAKGQLPPAKAWSNSEVKESRTRYAQMVEDLDKKYIKPAFVEDPNGMNLTDSLVLPYV